MHWIHYALPVLFCSIAGWVTTLVQMTFLFKPRRPLILAGIRLQGVIPKNKELIIRELARMASKEFLSSSLIEDKIADPENFEKIKPEIEKHIDHFLRIKLKDAFPLISQFIGDKTINKLKGAFLNELETLFPALIKNYAVSLKQGIDLEKIITEKLDGFSPAVHTTSALGQLIKKETLLMQLRGALVGFCVGLLQLGIMLMVF
jgi:uncharacterized membrane protein YheB (UPF0754 family)